MTLRFVPRFTEQIRRVAEAQQCIGRNVNNGNVFQRAAHGLKILSITTTWALENSVETADSMKSRAYGLRGRTNFSIYRFDRRDGMLLAFLVGVFGTLLFCIHLRKLKILYFPVFIMNKTTAGALLLYILYGILCMLPLILNIAEDRKWRSFEIRNLTFTYPDQEKPALTDLNFSLKHGGISGSLWQIRLRQIDAPAAF